MTYKIKNKKVKEKNTFEIDNDDLIDLAVDIGIEKGWYNEEGIWKSEDLRRKAYSEAHSKLLRGE